MPFALFRRLILPVSAGAVAIQVGFLSISLGQNDASKKLDLSNYDLSFSEDFDKLDVSAWGPGTRWIAHTPWNGDFGAAQFADPVPGFPFVVENGILRIEARREGNGTWRSGLLASADPKGAGFLQQFGYFEMRAKLPAGPGLWPAFWLIANKDKDSSAEIDILEQYGQFPGDFESVIHVWRHAPGAQNYQVTLRHKIPAGLLSSDFHLYGASVDADWIIIYLDRVEIGRTPTPPEHRRPMFILLNLALGGGWPIEQTPSPSYMFVDYVRAYTKKSQ
jgi:beta-glucanase (GH16 family)